MAIPHQPLSFRWPSEFIDSIDAARGDVPRSTFVRRAVELALGKAGTTGPGQQPRAESAVEEPRSRHQNRPAPTRPPASGAEAWDANWVSLSTREAGRCLTCGKANGVHKGDCPAHPRGKR